MNIKIKKHLLLYKGYKLKCAIGKSGINDTKKEGDLTTPKGIFSLGKVYYRKDRDIKPITKLDSICINKKMGWCNDVTNKKYNRLIKINKNIKYEKMFRKDYKYDYIVPINFNTKKTKIGRGSAIFIHLTKNYKPTAGCIALKKKDFLILLRLINKKTKIKII